MERPVSDVVQRLTSALIAQGRIVEAGWQSYRMVVIPANASTVQLVESRKAFFAGAQHLFSSIMVALDPGSEPTEADLERMDKINAELRAFGEEIQRSIVPKGKG
jgi:hypothetical protein